MNDKSLNTQFAFLKYIRYSYKVSIIGIIVSCVLFSIDDDKIWAIGLYIFLYYSLRLMFTLTLSFLKPLTLVDKHRYKIDFNKKTLKIKNYNVIREHNGLFGWKYILEAKTAEISIDAIDSIQRYKKYFVITAFPIREFLLPITKDTKNMVVLYNNIFQGLIGRKIRITKEYYYDFDFLINAKIIDVQENFDGWFQRRLIVIETENDVIVRDKNYGKILLLLNRYNDSYTANRVVHIHYVKNIQDLCYIHNTSKIDMDYFLMGYLEFL